MRETFDSEPPAELYDPTAFRRCLGCPTMVPTSVSDSDGRHISGSSGIYCLECSEDIMAGREEAAADLADARREAYEAHHDRPMP